MLLHFTFVHVCWIRVTSVKFHIIHIPISKRLGVDLQMPQHTGVTSTSKVAVVLVDTELQSQIVDLVKESSLV